MDEYTKLLTKSVFEQTALDSAVLRLKGDISVEAADELAALRAENARLREALENLVRRLDEHFGGVDKSYDWKEQEAARAALRGEQ